jgi:Flp pilus assembly protein TadD
LIGAVSDYNRAIEIDPKNEMAYGDRGLAKSDQGDFDGALIDYNQALSLKNFLRISNGAH